MEYVLETNALSKHYGPFKALDRLTMHVPKGAIYGFVGRNGFSIPRPGTIPCTVKKAATGHLPSPGEGWARWWKRPRSISTCRRKKI